MDCKNKKNKNWFPSNKKFCWTPSKEFLLLYKKNLTAKKNKNNLNPSNKKLLWTPSKKILFDQEKKWYWCFYPQSALVKRLSVSHMQEFY